MLYTKRRDFSYSFLFHSFVDSPAQQIPWCLLQSPRPFAEEEDDADAEGRNAKEEIKTTAIAQVLRAE